MVNRRLHQQSLDSTRNHQYKQHLSNWPVLIALEAGLALLFPIVATGLSFLFWQHSSDATPTAEAPSAPSLAMSDQRTVATAPASVLSVSNARDHAAVTEVLPAVPIVSKSANVAHPPIAPVAAMKVSVPDPSLSAALDEAVARELALRKPSVAKSVPPPAPIETSTTFQLADDLLADLDNCAIELDLRADPEAVPELLNTPFSVKGRAALVNVLRARGDLAGLPLRDARECEVDETQARRMTIVSAGIRQISPNEAAVKLVSLLKHNDIGIVSTLSRSARKPPIEQNARKRANHASDPLSREGSEEPGAVTSTLTQMLQVEKPEVRLKLVEHLSATRGREATLALADRALFDLSGTVRRAASEALRSRLPKEYQPQLADGLRYLWAPVARHAAEAFVQIGDDSAIALVEPLLDLPDPAAPRLDDHDRWVKSELVRVNHMRNCLLCHSASHQKTDLVRAMIPSPGQPLPAIYYDQISSSGNNFVRANSVYLKQDFSVMHSFANAHPWPEQQRFDYFVRTRRLSADEVAELPRGRAQVDFDYPERESVWFVLRELGKGGNRMVVMQD